eukprot:m.330436 g.330436  ORF g.330436 m.330436 type:complete len:1410 (+) comp16046_c1_seq1:474-4703(+)
MLPLILFLIQISLPFTAVSGCVTPGTCVLFQDSFCDTNTSALWLQHSLSEVPREFGNGPSCAVDDSRYVVADVFYPTGRVVPPLFLKAHASEPGRSNIISVGFLQTDQATIVGRYQGSTAFLCFPGISCHIASFGGLHGSKPDNFNRDLPVKLAVQTMGHRTLHWVVYNNDTEFMVAKSTFELDPALPQAIQPGYVITDGQYAGETCVDDFIVNRPHCDFGCNVTRDANACIQRTDCMWYQDSCVSYTSCPFDLDHSPLFCFNGTCNFQDSAGVSGACCDMMVNHCNMNPDDLGCDCELLGLHCPQLSCNSASFTAPPELCAASTYPVIQTSKRCEPNLTSVVLDIVAKEVNNPMCAVLVEGDSGLRCISEPCLYPPSSISGNSITCGLSDTVLSNELTLQVYAMESRPVTNDTLATCYRTMRELLLATHGTYSAQCESCPPGQLRILDVTPMCNLKPLQPVTVFTNIGPLEDVISCRFWYKAEDGLTWKSPDAWEVDVVYSTRDTVVCNVPDTFTPGIESHITVSAEGQYPGCARIPAPDPAGALVLSVSLLGELPATCQSCKIEEGTSISTGLVLPSPCASEACIELLAEDTYSQSCCHAISDFCSDSECSCTQVATAGCSVATSCTTSPVNTLIGTCSIHDVAVQVTALAGSVLTLLDVYSEEVFFRLLKQRIAAIGVPQHEISCVFLVHDGPHRVVLLFVHFSTQASAAVFEEALRSQSYTLFDDSFRPTNVPTTPQPGPNGLTLGAQIAIGIAFVVVAVVTVATASQRRRAKRAPNARADTYDTEMQLVEGTNGTAAPPVKSVKQGVHETDGESRQMTQTLQQAPSLPAPTLLPLSRGILLNFYKASFQTGLCDAMGASIPHLAAALGDKEMVNTIAESRSLGGQQAIGALDARGQTPLMWACQFVMHKDIVQLLIARGSQVNHQDADGFSALHHACRCDNLAAVQALLQNRVDPWLRDKEGDLAVHYAMQGRLAVEQLQLLSGSMHLTAVFDGHFRQSLLTQSVVSGKTSVRKSLLELGKCDVESTLAWINSKDVKGWTALHWSARLNDVEAVEDLLEAGADACCVDLSGNTALHLAVEEGSIWAASVLVPVTGKPANFAGVSARELLCSEMSRIRNMLPRPQDSGGRDSFSASTSSPLRESSLSSSSALTKTSSSSSAANPAAEGADPSSCSLSLPSWTLERNALLAGLEDTHGTDGLFDDLVLPPCDLDEVQVQSFGHHAQGSAGSATTATTTASINGSQAASATTQQQSPAADAPSPSGDGVTYTNHTSTSAVAATTATPPATQTTGSSADLHSLYAEYEVLLALLDDAAPPKRQVHRNKPRKSCWTGSEEQRHRNREACRRRRERMKEASGTVESRIERLTQLQTTMQEALKAMSRDRQSLLMAQPLDFEGLLTETSIV